MRALFIAIYLVIPFFAFSQLYINEFLASNNTNITDNFNESNDWVEIYNAGDKSIDMAGMYFSDTFAISTLWRVPLNNRKETTIKSGGYLIFWFDNDVEQGPLHANFKLKSAGEQISLYDSDGKTLIDQVIFQKQFPDVSYGRKDNKWVFFNIPTPNKQNITTDYNGVSNKIPVFSLHGGFYNKHQRLQLSCEDAKIVYTVDGSMPTETSTIFKRPILMDSTTVVKARVMQPGLILGSVSVHTYFINEKFEQRKLPVFSISSDPSYFWSKDIGIYAQAFKPKWQYPIHIEFYENNGVLGFSKEANIRIAGLNSWQLPQKMLSISLREPLQYKLINESIRETYNSFNLRCSGSDWSSTLFRDGLEQALTENDMDIDIQGYRPAIVYINGKYMGIHNIRQKANNNYLAEKYNTKKVDIIENHESVAEGDEIVYRELYRFFEDADFKKNKDFDAVKERIDIESFIDYVIIQIYVQNQSWGHNIALWKPKNIVGSKWRWLLIDLDRGFDRRRLGINGIEFLTTANGWKGVNPDWATLFLRKLLNNQEFKGLFISRLSDYLYTTLHPRTINYRISDFKEELENE